MENFVVSARKYRPARFEDVIGQPQVTLTLKNALKHQQLAQAFLFCGPRGVGKTTCARILAKVVNCENPTADFEACDNCSSCKSFNDGASMNIFELDAASNNSVDDIRALVEQVRYAPQHGKKKIYIIDEVHMLSAAAFNAFLKTLEEPPSYAIFILATTEKHKIIPTILSRCQIFDFKRIRIEDMASHLAMIAGREGIQADADALHIISQKADGALRDALSIFDRISIFGGGKITYTEVLNGLNVLDYDYFFRFTDCFLSENISTALLTFNDIQQAGFEGDTFLSGMSEHFRNLLMCKDTQTVALLETAESVNKKYLEQSAYTSSSFLMSALAITNEAEQQYKFAKNKRLSTELAIIRLCHLNNILNLHAEAPASKKKLSTTESVNGVKKTVPVSGQPKEAPTKETVKKTEPSMNMSFLSKLTEEHEEKIVQVEESIEEDLTPVVINLNEFQVALEKLFSFLLEKGKFNLANVLKMFPPEVNGEAGVLIIVSNAVQQNLVESEKEFLASYIKTELKLNRLPLKVSVDKNKAKTESTQKVYTPEDKFIYMSQKNPALLELKNRLRLELDY